LNGIVRPVAAAATTSMSDDHFDWVASCTDVAEEQILQKRYSFDCLLTDSIPGCRRIHLLAIPENFDDIALLSEAIQRFSVHLMRDELKLGNSTHTHTSVQNSIPSA
jgi:hypothetical protein